MIEFIVLTVAVIGLLTVFMRPGGPFSRTYNEVLTSASNEMLSLGERLASARGVSALDVSEEIAAALISETVGGDDIGSGSGWTSESGSRGGGGGNLLYSVYGG